MDLEKMQQSAKVATDMLKLLGHPDRLMVLCQLKTGEQSVGELWASRVQAVGNTQCFPGLVPDLSIAHPQTPSFESIMYFTGSV